MPKLKECQDKFKYNATLVSGVENTNAVRKPKEETSYKLKFRNSGTIDWPQETFLYQVNYSNVSAFRSGECRMRVGNCNVDGIKTIDIKVNSPSAPGTYNYDFRFGIESEGLFGGTF